MDRWSFVAGVCAGGTAVLVAPIIPWARLRSSLPQRFSAMQKQQQQQKIDEEEDGKRTTPSTKDTNNSASGTENDEGDVPENANEECPGTNADTAGKSAACAGCPNQQLCASGEARKVDPSALEVKQKLSEVRHKILVLSGKGGVGKSTVSAQLAFSLAKQLDVGLLDVDICGPSIPQMLGVKGSDVHMSADGWSPVYVDERLCVMSIGFMLPNQDDAIIWRGPRKNGLIKQFLTDVKWGALDALIIDTPPGTSDEHLSVVTYLKEAGISGAIIVTTPQEVALADVRKEINFCKKTDIPIIGVVENMSGFDCPSCHTVSHIFSAEISGGAVGMCNEMNVPYLGSIPLNPSVGRAAECGVKVQGASSAFIDALASKVISALSTLPAHPALTNLP
eukprot:GEMP01037652.1.p1 GENE.GEMP01037652.1~~GEMP01037652.1.p1  ORF type:complete len:421 (-),score=91.92 GEMP01037652.1:721-1899(-)